MREASGLPSGTVTFLFTDIERSTQTVEEMGNEAYADALDAHRRLLREAFGAKGGHEVGTEGDAFFVAFARAHDAVEAALAGQRVLDGSPLRVRMGIHTGEALVRQSDYVGHDVHKAKRISDAGHGGQVLVSQATVELVRDAFDLVDLGPHRLKDLGEPQRVFQVGGGEFPALRSLESFRTNLPTRASAFIGREKEIAEIETLLDGARLVTLTGVGGCGKTRLAQQVGAEVLDRYADGVFFADLAQLADPDVVPATVAAAVGVPMRADIGSGLRATTDELLFDFLARRTCLVILDNCEHLLDACAEVCDRILSTCPDVTVLATSREALDVDGEQSWWVPSLSLPSDDDAQSSEAVSLFKARAKGARPDFALSPQNLGAVAEICRRLDGIPLAIEFAAARVSHLSPQEISDRLGDMFKLLSGGRRRRMQRQQTLQAALDWSYELLTEPERLLLRRLAVFPASFPLEAAEGICSGDEVEERDVLDLLGSLVAKSLVTTEDREGRTRYRLIETVRQYASEKLRGAGEADAYRSRHRDWYRAWLEAIPWDDSLTYPAFLPIAEEQASLRSALEWSEAEDRLALVVAMAARMYGVWTYLGRAGEGLRWLTVAPPEELDLTPDERVVALSLTAFVGLVIQRPGDAELTDRAIAAGGEASGAPLAFAHFVRGNNLAIASQWTGDERLGRQAREEMLEAVRLAQGSPHIRRFAGRWRGAVELLLGDPEAASRYFAEEDPATTDEPLHLANRAAAAHLIGDHDTARRCARRFLEILRPNDPDQPYGGVVAAPAVAIAAAGSAYEGKAVLRGFLAEVRRFGRPGALEGLAVGAAAIAHLEGDDPPASRLLAWVRARTFDAGKIVTHPSHYVLYQHYVREVRAALDPVDARKYRDDGRKMSEDEAVALMLEVLEADASP